MFELNLTSIVGSHIIVSKRGAIAKVVRGVKIFKFEIWGDLREGIFKQIVQTH
jgi:hypothetical protein